MDILTYFIALFTSILIVIPTCFYLFKCRSYIKISLLVVALYLVILGVVYLVEWRMSNNKSISSVLTTQPTTTTPTANIPELESELPFDGLPPNELLKNMQYLYRATSNPLNIPSQQGTLTDADNTLNKDRDQSNATNGTLVDSGIMSGSPAYMSYAATYYPNLTIEQVDTRDCLNDMGANSCFQSSKMFEKANNILDKGITKENAGIIVREDFVNFENSAKVNLYSQTPFYDNMEPIFMNAPANISGRDSNTGDISINGCRGCKISICTGDYCATANQLFN